jgi:endothelin-converting enzyme
VPDYDEQILDKLRGLYSSCMNEDHLNDLGDEPLVKFTGTLRKLLRGKTLRVDLDDIVKDSDKVKQPGLTAALSFLHSRGMTLLAAFDCKAASDVDNRCRCSACV